MYGDNPMWIEMKIAFAGIVLGFNSYIEVLWHKKMQFLEEWPAMLQ